MAFLSISLMQAVYRILDGMPRLSYKLKLFAVVAVVAVIGYFVLLPDNTAIPGADQDTQNIPGFNKKRYSRTSPKSLWVVANKRHPLPADYVPSDLVLPNIPRRGSGDEAYVSKKITPALEAMVAAAKKSGLNLMQASGYRSYGLQQIVYSNYVRTLGQTEADRVSAKPGASEHQTGLAVDLEPTSGQCEVEICFGDLPEGKWLAAHARTYGFIIRYPKGKESVTGYSYEPWHLRYVGKELAAELKKQKIQTLEEFFGL
jgi:zinc D-Ala-D-Ala carboxypeptidase